MIVSGYTIHLYCDCCQITGHSRPVEYFHELPSAAWRLARRDGWRFRLVGRRAHLAKCPECVKAKKPFPKN